MDIEYYKRLYETWVGKTFKHSNGYEYLVIDVAFHGDTDEWHLVHVRPDCSVKFTRTTDNLLDNPKITWSE